MTSISKITALVAFFGMPATATVCAAETDAGATCPDLAWVTVDGEPVQLPQDVAQNVTMLQGYGMRYARVIALIVEENARPD